MNGSSLAAFEASLLALEVNVEFMGVGVDLHDFVLGLHSLHSVDILNPIGKRIDLLVHVPDVRLDLV